MDPFGAVTSLIGGFLNRDAQKDANQVNAQTAANNIALQREFAQNGIQWKAADAEKAGIHPVYAMGANTTSFSPVTVGAVPESGLGSALQSMGQDMTRSRVASPPPLGKVAAIQTAQQTASNSLDLETKEVNLALLKARLAALGPGIPPGVPFDVPEKNKPEERPPLMAGNNRWLTNPNTSPAKAFEDQYGDDGPASWLINAGILGNDAIYNLNKRTKINTDDWEKGFSTMPGQVARWYQAAKHGYYNKSAPLPERPTYRHERR